MPDVATVRIKHPDTPGATMLINADEYVKATHGPKLKDPTTPTAPTAPATA